MDFFKSWLDFVVLILLTVAGFLLMAGFVIGSVVLGSTP
jgi:hypothetical protein